MFTEGRALVLYTWGIVTSVLLCAFVVGWRVCFIIEYIVEPMSSTAQVGIFVLNVASLVLAALATAYICTIINKLSKNIRIK